MSGTFWLLAANSSEARLLSGKGPNSDFEEFETFANGAGHAQEHELVSDRPGRFSDGRQHTSATETHHKERAADTFAKEIADYLQSAHGAGRFDRLAIVAAPSFLGRLRKSLSKPVSDSVLEEISKDDVQAAPAKLASHLTRLA